jgi:hypothetical protein
MRPDTDLAVLPISPLAEKTTMKSAFCMLSLSLSLSLSVSLSLSLSLSSKEEVDNAVALPRVT